MEATASIEADVAFLDDADRAKADMVEGAIGEMSGFHAAYGYYAEGIHVDTAVLPEGWRDRLVDWDLQSSDPARPRFLEPHDLAVAKLAAGRDKDATLLQRAEMLSDDHEVHRDRIRAHVQFYRGTDR